MPTMIAVRSHGMRMLACHIKLALTMALGGNVLEAQAVVRIPSEVLCASCSIKVEKVVTLQFDGDFSAPPTWLQRDPQGFYYLIDPGDRLLKVFDANGRFVRQIGKRGGGPGEYETLRNVLIAGDGSIHVLDIALGRRSVFARDGAFLGSTSIRVQGGQGMPAALLPNNELIVNARFLPNDGQGYVLQRIDQKGVTTQRFDAVDTEWRKTWLQHRLLAVRADGGLVVARPFTFRIDLYNAALSKMQSIVRVAAWVPSGEPAEQPSGGVYDEPATPQLWSVWEAPSDLLWLLMYVPSRRWQPASPLPPDLPPSDRRLAALISRPRIETIIEVVDLKQLRVLARTRVDGILGSSIGGGYLFVPPTDMNDEPGIPIYRITLKR